MKLRIDETNIYVPLNELVENNLPCYYKENIITKEICTEYAKGLAFISNEVKGLANILYLFSNECLIISQILQLKKTTNFSELSLNECSYEFISTFKMFLPECALKYNNIRTEKFSKLKFKYIVKYFYNKIFLVLGKFSKAKFANKKILKAWVEISFDIYKKNEFDIVILLPFFLSIKRQAKFIKYLIEKKYCFTFYGYGYSIKKLIMFIFNPTSLNLYRLELSGCNHFVNYIKNRGIPSVLLCTDEFEPVNYQIYEDFMQEGIYVQNKAHGIGKYCPHVNYSNFVVFNSSMANFYDNNCVKLNNPVPRQNKLNTIKYIILVDQNTSFRTFQKFRSEIIDILIDIERETNLKCLIKLHPNQNTHYKFPLKCIKEFGDFSKNSLVINIFSSCFYSVTDCVENIYVTNHIYDGDIYNNDTGSVSVDKLASYLENFQ